MATQSISSHVLYVDDSGTKEYDERQEYSRRGNTRYFVFGAVLLGRAYSARLAEEIVTLKRSTFSSSDVEIKSNWLRMPLERDKRYLKPFGLTEERLTSFVDDFYALLARANVTFLAAVIDKKHMQEKYPKPWYAPAVAYEILLQRAQLECAARGPDDTYSLFVDDMSGATPKQNQYKDNLRRQHARLKQRGSSLQKGFAFSGLLGPIRFANSARSHLVQVADVISYNVYRQFVEYGDKWEDEGLS